MSQDLQPQNGNIVLVAIGGNATSIKGTPLETVLSALAALENRFGGLHSSRLYQTPAFPAGSGPDFVNAVGLLRTDFPAPQVLDILHSIEADHGRTRETRWGQRTLDLDLIAYDTQVLPDLTTYKQWQTLPIEAQKTIAPTTLVLPHPRVQDRAFVLVPLADVAPQWRHPVLNLTVTDMIKALPAAQIAEIRVL